MNLSNPSFVEVIKKLHLSDENSEMYINTLMSNYSSDARYQLFNRIRQSVLAERRKDKKKQNITGRLEGELNFVCYMEDLKILIKSIYKIEQDINLSFDWNNDVDILKKVNQRQRFVSEFVKVFVATFC